MSATLRIAAAFALIAICSAGACGATARQAAPAADGWRVSFSMSGGFAGFDRTLDIASTGELTAADRKRGMRISRQATIAELAEIKSFVDTMKSPASSRRRTDCRDCLEYSLDVRRGGARFETTLDDTSIGDSGLAPLVAALTTLLNRALAQN